MTTEKLSWDRAQQAPPAGLTTNTEAKSRQCITLVKRAPKIGSRLRNAVSVTAPCDLSGFGLLPLKNITVYTFVLFSLVYV